MLPSVTYVLYIVPLYRKSVWPALKYDYGFHKKKFDVTSLLFIIKTIEAVKDTFAHTSDSFAFRS